MPAEVNSSATPSARAPIDPNNPPWGLGGAVLVLIVSILVQAVFGIVFLVPYSLQRGLNPASPDFKTNLVLLATTDPTAIFLQVLALLPSHLVTLGLVWVVVTRFGKLPFLASLGWGRSNGLELGLCVGLGIILFGMATAIAWLLGIDKPTQLEQIINSSLAARYTIAVLAVFTAPFVEEFIYRGVLYSALQRIAGVAGAVIIVLGVFTLIHVPQYWPNFGVIAAVGLLSVVLTVIRAYTSRLLPCIVIHLVFNAIQSVLLLVEPHLPGFRQTSDQTASIVLSLASFAYSIFKFL